MPVTSNRADPKEDHDWQPAGRLRGTDCTPVLLGGTFVDWIALRHANILARPLELRSTDSPFAFAQGRRGVCSH